MALSPEEQALLQAQLQQQAAQQAQLQQQMVLQSQLLAIQSRIASGVERASYDGKSTDFRSLEELYKIRDDLQTQLGLKVRVRRTAVSYNGGF